jgi:hypothetical protein
VKPTLAPIRRRLRKGLIKSVGDECLSQFQRSRSRFSFGARFGCQSDPRLMDHRLQRAPPPFHSSDRSEANIGSTCISPLQKSGAGRRTSPRLPSTTAFAVRPKRTCRDGGLRLCRLHHLQSNVYLITQFLPSDRRCRTLLYAHDRQTVAGSLPDRPSGHP